MNRLSGHISEVKADGALSQVTVKLSAGTVIKAIVIENPETAAYLRKDHPIYLIFKETEVILSKEEQKLSLLNKIKAKVNKIRKGTLLSEVHLRSADGPIRAVISSEALDHLNLKVEDPVIAMIKQNEIMLGE